MSEQYRPSPKKRPSGAPPAPPSRKRPSGPPPAPSSRRRPSGVPSPASSERQAFDRTITPSDSAGLDPRNGERDHSVPHAPHRRRNTPIDYAEKYQISPKTTDAFDTLDTEDDIMGRADPEPAKKAGYGAGSDIDFDDDLLPDDAPRAEKPSNLPAWLTEEDDDDFGPVRPYGEHAPDRDRPMREPPRRGPEPPRRGADRSGGNRPPERPRRRPRGPARGGRPGRGRMKTRTKIRLALILIAAVVLLTGIYLFRHYSLVDGELIPLDTTVLDLSNRDMTRLTGIARLKQLEHLDITGNNISIKKFDKLAKKLPDCEIVWDVPFNSAISVNSTVSDADLSSSSDLSIEDIRTGAPYLTSLGKLDVRGCGLDDEQLYQLESSFENVDIVWDVETLGQRLPTDIRVIKVGSVTADQLEQFISKIKYFDRFEYLDLSGSGLSNDELFDFSTRHPEAKSAWKIDLFGQSVYNNAAELRFESTSENPIKDISNLKYFYKLQALYIHKGQIADLSPLSGLSTLRILSLTNCSISNISPLEPLTGLVYLELNNNKISDLSPLSGMMQLEELHLNYNKISKLAPLSGLEKLKTLNVQANELVNLKGFSNLPSLENLSLRINHLTYSDDVKPLLGITSLKVVDLQQNDFKNKVEAVIIDDFKARLPDCTLYIWK